MSYGRAALLMDLADVGGNVKDGCHIASMGGTWMVFTYGFGGLRDYDGRLFFRPQRPPEAQSSLQFPLTYRGQVLDVDISPIRQPILCGRERAGHPSRRRSYYIDPGESRSSGQP